MMIKLTIILSSLFALLLFQYAITAKLFAVAQTPSPTIRPTTRSPTVRPTTGSPTVRPTTRAPTRNPTLAPTTKAPTNTPTTRSPTTTPTTVAPTTAAPTKNPTRTPTTPAPTYSPVPSASPIVPDVCASGWTTFNGRCFINIPVAQNWGATEADCNGVLSGATLASLNSAAEVNFIKNTFSCTDINNICWIGGYQVQGQANDQWQWKDGTSYLHSSYTGASLWLSGEPNNAHLGTSTTADCMGMYDTGFTDLSCSATYKGICVATAACRAGYYKTSSYSVTLSPTLSVSQGVCTRCPAGKYRTLSDAESQCIDCDAGYMGSAGAFQSTCTSPCPDGYYCPKGTATGSQIPCPAGKYGNGQAQTSAETGCTACAAGKYCTIGSTSADIKNCQAGYCGFSQASTATCSQACTPGYYCPTGSECPSTFGETRTKAAWECGGNNVYCPSGSQSPVTVQDGYYSIGGTGPTTRSSIVDCEKGYYCTGGVRTACPAGRYGPSVRLTSASGCLSCNAGYFCDLASISPNNDHCAPTSAPTSIWTTYYCPAGTSSRLTTTGTEITTPTTAPTQNREGKTTCPQNSVCANGVASSKLSWGGSTPVCDSTIKVAEMSAANTILADFDAVLSNLLSNPGAYTITYSLQSFDYYNIATNPQCSPTTAAKNGGGLFSVNPSNGQFFLSAATLNFEVCLPIIDIKYAATIRATAVGESTTTNLDCTVYVEVTDVNDQPKFSAPTSYRMIKEKQLKNTPVSRCDADAVANFGCPVNEGNLDGAILATDEDDGSALTYTFDSGNEAGFFKINPCTGVISYSDNYEVSFSFAAAKPRFTFVVRATDDGNGGRFATKFTTQTVNLYLININDAPVLPDPGTGNYFTIAELQAAGTSLTPGLLTPTDEDGDTVTLTLISNDANAFTLDSNLYTIKTSAAGALGINFETSKKVYQIQVLASDGVASTVQTYKIGVTNANDPPVFDTSRLVFYIEENKAAGSVVCSTSSGSCTEDPIHKLLVTDEDNIGTDVTTFSLLDNTDLFTVDSNGYIKVVTPLDFEADQTNRNVNAGTGRRIQVTVRATSSGVGVSTPAVPKSTTTTITIYIVDVNEAPIIGGGQPLITSTLESWPTDTVLSLNPTLFSAVDPDNADTIIFGATAPVQTITYEMGTFGGTSGLDGSSLFSVATTVSGALQVKVVGSLLNAPSNVACGGSSGRCYQFTLVAKDNGGPRQQSTATVTVRIIDTNQPPVFSSSAVSLSVSEDPTVAYAGITYSATDPDAGTTLSFAVVGGTGTSAFTLEGAGTNQFKIKKTAAAMTVENPLINFESVIKSWTLRVRAYDAGPSSYIGQVCKFDVTKTIVLVGCGDTGGAYCYEVDERCYETCLPTTVSTKAVIDARPRINGYFCDYNGETKVGSYPDYAETTFTIAIDDANDPPLIVDDDNNAYNTGCKLSGSVSSVLSTVQRAKGDLSVIDEDDNIPSATFKGAPFVFTATDALASFWSSFTINSATGVISSKALTIPQGTYSTNITVTDSNVSGGTKSSTCVIEITSSNLNRPPVISVVTASVTINENTATGTPLNFGVSAIDPESQTVTFSTSVSGFWTVSSTTGVVTTSDSLLDYESSKNLGYKRTLLITATDSSGATDSKLLTINIADVNEAPYWKTSLSTIQVPENTAINALVGSSLVSSVDDPDTDAVNAAWRSLSFSMSCGPCPFDINTATGQIYPKAALDFETLPNSWTATITVSDGGTPSLSSSTTVTIQLTNFNEAPFFKTASPNLQIAERDTSNQDLLFDMSSIVGDPDASDPVSSLTFTLGAPGNSLFTVTNGWLQLKTGVSFDYESVQSYTFTVSIQDSGGLSASQSITVTVTDVNDMSILSVSGGTSGVLSCAGGEQLTITGTNFGFKDHGSNPAHAPTVLEVTYWYTTTNVNDVAKIYTATGCAVTSGGNTEIKCNSVVGVGTGLNFKIRLGVTSTSLNENSNIATLVTGLKYSPPQITTVSSSAVDMPTVGGTAITIDGTCLGIENDGQKMNHGLTSGRDSYIQYCSVSACYVPVCTNTGVGADNRWSCTSRPGIGKDIYWNIRVAGQTAASSFVYGTYGRPVLNSQSFTDLPTTGVFSSNMVISGTNFGDTNEVPSTAKIVFTFIDTVTSQSTTEEYALTGCKVTSAAGLRNQVTCTGSAPAVGTAGSVILEFGGLSNLPNQVTATYQRATLTAIDGNGVSKFETIGGQLVTLTGTSFGPACGVAASNSEFGSDEGTPCGHLLITYSNGSKKQSNQSITLSYRPTCAIVSNTRIVCKMAPGSGANHVWSITVGQRLGIIGIDVPTTSYVSPTVGAYSGDGSKNALTQGGQTIYISGSNFGPADGASVEAYYGNQLRPKEFYAGTCAVTTAHQVVTCTTSQGVGSGLVWVVYVDGLESRSELMSYGPPAVASFPNYPAAGLSPDGGFSIILSGSNFGPTIANSPGGNLVFLQKVSYGPSTEPGVYEATDCVVNSHTQITCKTAPGIGISQAWSVTVEGQTSLTTSFRTSYVPLELQSLSVTTGKTNGGYTSRIRGKGLAICDPNAAIRIVFGDTTVNGGNTYNDGGAAKTCPSTESRLVEFVVPPRTGDRVVSVTVRMSSSKHSQTVLASQSFSFTYDTPVIDQVYAEPGGAAGAVAVTLVGTNFCASEACCTTYFDGQPAENIASHGHDKIKFYAPRAGSTYIKCIDGFSTVPKQFEASSPFIAGTIPRLDSLEFSTTGGDLVEVWGVYFGSSAPNVTVGNFQATVVSHTRVECNDPAQPATMLAMSFDVGAPCFKTVIRVPQGGGKSLPLVVTTAAGEQKSLADDSRFEFLSYISPVITAVSGAGSGKRFPTPGSSTDIVTITGTNFYITGSISIGDSAEGISCNPVTWTHNSITCRVGEGEGTDLKWSVVVEGERSAYFGDASNSVYYLPPSGLSFTSSTPTDGWSTQGSEVITITGSNLGRNLKQTVTIGGRTCTVTASGHTQVSCSTPEGEGINLVLSVTVGGQSANSPTPFSYGPPKVTSISPTLSPTRATNPNTGDSLILIINGKNFGYDVVSAYLKDENILLGERNSQKDIDQITKPFIVATHTQLRVYIPSYYGKNLPIKITVKGQSVITSTEGTMLSYVEPSVTVVTQETSAGTSEQFPTGVYTPPPPNAGFGTSTSGRRLDTSPYGDWESEEFSACTGDHRIKGIFWRVYWSIAASGAYTKTVSVYSDSDCSASSLAHTGIVTGKLFDLGTNPSVSCAQSFEDAVDTVVITPTQTGITLLNQRCTCPTGTATFTTAGTSIDIEPCLVGLTSLSSANQTCLDLSLIYHAGSKYGMYVIVGDTDLYISKLFPSISSLYSAEAFGISDTPSAVAKLVPTVVGPVFPTDGCYIWEDNNAFNARRRLSANAQRKCLDIAFLTLTGSNFGFNSINATGVLRVTFVNPATGDEFEASTTSSEGNHLQICTETMGCVHTHELIKVWVPYGSGRGLRVKVQVGNQAIFANVTVNYGAPEVDAMFPGTIFRKAAFQNAEGERVVMQGSNFGWTGSRADVLINGRRCSDTIWNAGSDGEPYVECIAPRDTVGPKSVFACIGNQTYISKVFKTDPAVLAAGEAAGAWADGVDVVQSETKGYGSRVFSWTVTRCPKNKYGRLFELCTSCPVGASCGIGSFAQPVSQSGFYGVEINVKENPERAALRCSSESSGNETELANFPDAVVRDTCYDFVKCEPAESCSGGNECAGEYRYALDKCEAARGLVRNGTQYVSPKGVVLTTNACGVVKNPYTGEYEGVHSDCRGNLTLGAACDWQRPWECSMCELKYPTTSGNLTESEVPVGECTCTYPTRCALCTIGTHYRFNNACKKCPQNVEVLITLFILAAISACGAAYYLSKKKINLAFVAIAVDYFQILAVFASTRVPWPDAILRLFEIMSLFNINIDIAAPECLLPSFEYEVKFYATEFLPLAALGVLLVIHLFYTFYKLFRDGRRVKIGSHLSKLISVFLIIMYFLYLTVTKRALDIFNCNPTTPSDGYLYTEFTSMKCDGGGLCRCDEKGGVQQSLVPASYAFIVLYSFGFPLFTFFVIYTNKTKIMEDQYLRAYGIGDTRETNPDAYDLRKKYHLLYMYYKPRTPYWLLAILFRKFMIVMSSLMFRGNPTFQMSVMLLVLFWSFVMQARFRPFLSSGEKGVVIKELEARAANAINDPAHFQADYEMLKKVTTAVRLGAEAERRAKENKYQRKNENFWDKDVTNIARKNRTTAKVAQEYFFDFNTVELILLGCSIFICLCGIMFHSNRYSTRKDTTSERDALAYILILVVVFSFIYLILIVLGEIAPWITARLARYFLKHNDAMIQKQLDEGVVTNENPLLNAKVIGAHNAEDLTRAIESNINALQKTKEQNKQLEADLRKMKMTT